MPIYEYRCDYCGFQYEIRQNIKDKPIRFCENCGKNGLKRLISGGNGIIFKGEGFYCTENKK